MAKGKSRKVTVQANEQCVITSNRDSIMIFKEHEDSKTTMIELIIPDQECIDDNEIMNSITLATAIAVKLRGDQYFAANLLSWFKDYLESINEAQQSAEMLN